MAEETGTTSVDVEQPVEQPTDNMFKDTVEGVATGIAKGMNEISEAADTVTLGGLDVVASWLNENVADLGTLGVNDNGELVYFRAANALKEARNLGLEGQERDDYVLERVTQYKLTDGLQTFAGNAASGLTQFATGWIATNPVNKVVKPVTTGGKLILSAARGGAAELLAFDEQEDRLSNLIEEYPHLENPITAYLAADPNDAKAEAVFKQALEGVATGVLFDSLFAGIKALKANRQDFANTEELVQEATNQSRRVVDEIANETEEALAAWEKANEVLVTKYDEASGQTGAARTETRKQGREGLVEELTESQKTDLASRGGGVVISNEQMSREARTEIARFLEPYSENLTLGVDEWVNRFGGDVVRARRVLARSIEMVQVADTNFSNVLTKFNAGEATQQQLAEAFKSVVTVTNVARGGISEAGRMLNFSKIVDGWNVTTLNTAMQAGSALQGNLRGRRKFMFYMAKYANQIQKGGSRSVDMINELFINSILSGVKTHLVNIGSNTFTMATMPIERLGGAIIALDGKEAVKALRIYQGFGHAAWDSLKGAAHALKTGQTRLDITRSTLEDGLRNGAIPTVLGDIIRLPTRALAAEDEFFKQMNFRAYAFAEAMADGKALGKSGDELRDYVADEVATAVQSQLDASMAGIAVPENAIAQRAIQQGREATFTQSLDDAKGVPVFGAGSRISQGIQSAINDFPILRQINPFVRTPLNIFSYTLQRSPLAPLSGRFWKDIGQGGAKAGQAAARFSVGLGLSHYFYNLAQQGAITGTGAGLTLEQKKAMEQMYGYKTNAVYDNVAYYDVSRMSPASDLMTIMASIYELNKFGHYDEATELAMGVTMVLTEFARDKTFMRGLSDFINAVEDPERYATSYVGSRAGALVPFSGLLKSLNGDPNLRRINEIAEGYKKTLPFMSEDLDPVRNIVGEEVLVPEFWGINFMSPIGHSTVKDDPLGIAFKKAADAGVPYNIGLPSRTKSGIDLTNSEFSVDLQGKPLNPERVKQTAYDSWLELSGTVKFKYEGKPSTLRQALTAVVTDPRFDSQSTGNIRIGDRVYTGKRQDQLKNVIKHYRDNAWKILVGRNPREKGSTSGIFDDAGNLLSVRKAKNPKLAVAYWTEQFNASQAAKSPEGQEWMKGNTQAIEERIKGIFSQGSNE